MTVQERMKTVRDRHGKTQKEMAQSLGISPRTWQDYEGGVNVPGWKVLEGLARMGLNVNWLLTGVGPEELHKEEVMRLLCVEAHDKLKKRIKDITKPTPARLYNIQNITFEQIQAYLKGEYWPNSDQLISLCQRAGAAFSDKEFLDIILSVDPALLSQVKQDKTIECTAKAMVVEVNEELLKDIIRLTEEAYLELNYKLAPDKRADLIMFLYNWYRKEAPIGAKVDKDTVLRVIKFQA